MAIGQYNRRIGVADNMASDRTDGWPVCVLVACAKEMEQQSAVRRVSMQQPLCLKISILLPT